MFGVFFVFLSCICIVWLCQIHWKRRSMYKLANVVKGPKPSPIIGNALPLLMAKQDHLSFFMKLCNEYSSPFTFWLGPKLLYFISDLKNVEIIINSPVALARDDTYLIALNVFKGAMILSPGKSHEYFQNYLLLFKTCSAEMEKNKKWLGPFFTQKNIKEFLDQFNKVSLSWVENDLKNAAGKGSFDVLCDYLRRYALLMTFKTSLGASMDLQTADYISKLAKRGQKLGFKRCLNLLLHSDFIYNLTSEGKEYKQIENEIFPTIEKFIVEQKVSRKDNFADCPKEEVKDQKGQRKSTYLDFLLDLKSRNCMSLTDYELRAEIFSSVIGGQDAMSSVVAFVFVMLGIHQNLQQKLYDEVMEVIGQNDSIKSGNLPNLKYLDWVIKETLRLFPPIPNSLHYVESDTKLETCTIPSGSSVLLPILFIHRNEKYWQDALKFNPERFSPQQIKNKKPYAYLPFFAGARNCSGQNYALINMKVIIAIIIRKFKISTEYKSVEDIKLKCDISLFPVDGYNISLELRN